jgi:monolysocardiolipin acyltransferase
MKTALFSVSHHSIEIRKKAIHLHNHIKKYILKKNTIFENMQAAGRAVKLTSATGLGMYGVSMITLHIDAPPADVGDGKYEVQRKKQIFPTWFHDIGRIPTIAAGTFLAKFFLHYVNTSSQKGVDILMKHMDERPPNTSLITVSNHTATVDDPAVLASYLPWSYCVPWRSRWSLCR